MLPPIALPHGKTFFLSRQSPAAPHHQYWFDTLVKTNTHYYYHKRHKAVNPLPNMLQKQFEHFKSLNTTSMVNNQVHDLTYSINWFHHESSVLVRFLSIKRLSDFYLLAQLWNYFKWYLRFVKKSSLHYIRI